jgi:subtilisin family serine protease
MLSRRPFAAALTLALVAPVTALSTSPASAAPTTTATSATTPSAAPTAKPGAKAKHQSRPKRSRDVQPAHDPHTVLVKFKATASKTARDKATRSRGGRTAEALAGTGFVKVTTTGKADELASRLASDPAVAEVTLDYIRKANATPNDPYYGSGDQSYLATVRMPGAWDRSQGSLTPVVAVIDTGVNGEHPDLTGRTMSGMTFVPTPAEGIPTGANSDDAGHGSMVAGIVAAETSNAEGIAGVAWKAKVMPVKVLDSTGQGSDSNVIKGIDWAVSHGAKIINLSLGGPDDSPALHQAVTDAVSKGVFVVVAAGNSGSDEPEYPAAYPEAFAVGATDSQGAVTDFSTYGDWVDVAAPGWGIWSTDMFGGYEFGDGTSFAAPIVSGVAVLIRTQNPTWTPAQIAARLRTTARDAGPRGIDPFYGAGVVDATNALGGGSAPEFSMPALGSGEPNDLPSRATALTGSASATFAVEGDADWYRIESSALQPVSVTVTPAAYDSNFPQNADPVISVYDQNLGQVVVGDHNGPGGPELAGFTAPPGTTYVKVQNYNGARDTRPYTVSLGRHTGRLLNSPTWLEQPTPQDGATAVADVTGDGRDDVVAIVGAYGDAVIPRGVLVYPQTGSGEFGPSSFYPTADGEAVMRLDVADVDGDGAIDVLAATFSGLQAFYQAADGSLGDAQFLAQVEFAQAHDVAAADLDGDGDTDVVAAINGSPSIRIRQADGTYTEAVRFRMSTFDLAIGDVDGDGRPDVVGSSGAGVRVFHNEPSGWRDTAHDVSLPANSSVGGVQIVDLNRDGRTDVAAIIRSFDGPAALATFAQGEDGQLGSPTTTALPNFSETLAAADVTGDGIPDLVTSGTGPNASISVLPGLAGGGVGAPVTTTIGASIWPARQGELSTGDLDGDGRVDAALMTRTGVAVLHNATAETPAIQPALWVRSATPADFGGSAVTAAPTVTFARDVAPASVSASTVGILDGKTGARVPATVTYEASTRVATIRPSTALPEGAPYRLLVSGVQDSSGATMTTAFTSTYRTTDTPPPAVGGFKVAGGFRAATLTWTAPAINDLDRYIVRMATGSTAPASVTSGSSAYSGAGTSVSLALAQGTTYSFRIWPKDRGGNYGPSSAVTIVGTTETMASNVTSVTYGGSVTVSTRITRGVNGAAVAGVPMQLYMRRAGTTAWALLATRTTSSTGTVSVVHKPTTSLDYQWIYRGSNTFVGSASAVRRVSVRAAVTSAVSRTTLPLGGTFTVSGSVAPTHAGRAVYVQRYAGNNVWTTVTSRALTSTSTYAFSVKPTARGTFTYRVYLPADTDHLASYSPSRAVKVT